MTLPPPLQLTPDPPPKPSVWSYLVKAWREFDWTDLRWSHLWIVAAIVAAGSINLVLPNGWTVWPLVPVIAAMVVVNEAADRNDQGVPPLQVYGFIALVVGVWSLGVLVMSKVPVIIQLLGVGVLAWYSIRGYMQYIKKQQLIALRRAEGCCIYCGEHCEVSDTFCGNCGLEPDPGRSEAQRLAAIVQFGNKKGGHARAVLEQESHGQSAHRKEQDLLARALHRQRRQPRR